MISVIIPALNEEVGLGMLIPRLQEILKQQSISPAEIIVVNDGSTDKTEAVALTYGARVINHVIPKGYGFSLKDGIAAATYDTIIVVDADNTYDPADIPILVQEYCRGFDMVIGSRQGFEQIEQPGKRALRAALGLTVGFVTGTPVPDVNSGLRIFSKKTISHYLADLADGFSFTTSSTLTYLLSHLSVSFFPINYGKRTGTSKVRLLRDSLRTAQYLIEAIARYNPVKLFIALAGIYLLALSPIFLILLAFNSLLSLLVLALGMLGVFLITGIGFACRALQLTKVNRLYE